MKNFSELADQATIERTIKAIAERGVEPMLVANKEEAMAKIKELIPAGASVMNGSSVTLEQIGFVNYLKDGAHGWNNLHAAIVAETDKPKQMALRKAALNSDYYLGSVHAIAETGELVIASNTGSQLPHIVFTSPNIIFVASTKKIAADLPEALKRLNEYVVPLEDVHMKEKSKGAYGTMLSKIFIMNRENPMMGRKVRIILVNEDLGF